MNPSARQYFVQVALPVPLPGVFDYLVPEEYAEIPTGTRVSVPFGNRKLAGIVTASSTQSEVARSRILPVTKVLDECKPLLNGELMGLLEWCSRYYKHPLGEVLFNALPPRLRRPAGAIPAPGVQYRLTEDGKHRLAEPPGRARKQFELLGLLEQGPVSPESLRSWHARWRPILAPLLNNGWAVEEPEQAMVPACVAGPRLTAEQARAVEKIGAGLDGFRCHLLDGITGSGKTEVYLKLIETVMESGRQVLVLVPEIGLTPQLVRRFSDRLGLQPAVYHSGLSDGQRLATWAAAKRGMAHLFLGTRSALFLPLLNPGLIIMDESHDASFKQQDGFRFSARDVAVKRASGAGIPIVLGTATPSLETVHNAGQGRYEWVRLRKRATGALAPSWRVLDMRRQPAKGGLLEPVVDAIGETLGQGGQVIVFLNRRGYAPVLLCHECGWHAQCARCDSNLTWHRSARNLVCHHCEHRQGVPSTCPDCAADALQGAGEGTQQLEQMLARRFPDFPLYRFDRDELSRKGSFEQLYTKVRDGGPCILVGTQMLAKGHHFPLVTRVVIVSLDQALYSGDYRAMERLGQLMVQVAGRAGREERPGEVILQTHHPDHPVLETLFASGYPAFAQQLLRERELASLPPFSCQALLRAEAADRAPVQEFLNASRRCFESPDCRVFGPYPAQMERKGGRLRWYLLIQSGNRRSLHASLDSWLPRVRKIPSARRVRWAVDVDPQEF